MVKYGLSHSEEAVLSVLRYVSKDGLWEGSYADLARLAGFGSRKTLFDIVTRLESMGLLLTENNGARTVFMVCKNRTEVSENRTEVSENDKKERKEAKEIKKEKKEENILYIFNNKKNKETAAGDFENKINKPSGVKEVAEYCETHAQVFNFQACKEYYYYNEGRGWRGVSDWHFDFAYRYNKIRRRIERTAVQTASLTEYRPLR